MQNVFKLARYAIAGWVPGGRRRCVVCDHKVWRFMPYKSGSRGVPALMLVLDTVGSNPDQFECPHCGAHDRERHLLMYMRASGLLERLKNKSVLHFAPEKHLSRFIREAAPALYARADLFPNSPDVQPVDMLSMPFRSGALDVVIANHVLEHVADADRALAEVNRVLKPGGFAVLQTPYSRKLRRTWQDAGIDSPELRLQAHGQEDHVRLFGRDIFERIMFAGFESRVRQHSELLPGVDSVKTGVNPAEPFFLFQKPD